MVPIYYDGVIEIYSSMSLYDISVIRKVTISKNLEKTEGKPQKNSKTEKIARKDRKKVSRRDCDGIVMKIRKKFGEDENICDIKFQRKTTPVSKAT